MSEASSTVENEPPHVAPVITTRAKVVRESFTVLRSDFEPAPTVAVRPQRPAAEPTSRGGGQNNLAVYGGGVLLVGGIFAFLFFGYGSNKGNPAAAPSAVPKGAADVVVTPIHPAKDPKPVAHTSPAVKPSIPAPVEHHEVAVAPHVVPAPHKAAPEGAANTVVTHVPQHIPETSHTTPHERPVEHVVVKPIAHVEAPKPVVHIVHADPPVHHTPQASHESSAPAPHHHDDSTDLDPLHSLGN